MALLSLRERVEREHGAGFLRARQAALCGELGAISPGTGRRAAGASSPGRPAAPPDAFAEGYRERLVGLFALAALDSALPLRADAYRAPGDDDLLLGEDERRALDAFAARLEGELARLAASERPDWGFALLVGMARLVALRQSVESGRLVLLDPFPDEPERVRGAELERRRDLLPDLVGEARLELVAARRALAAGVSLREAEWTAIETTGNRLLELEDAAQFGRDLRLAPGPLVPSRAARRADLVEPALSAAELEQALAAARDAQESYRAELGRRHGYDLLTRNCVTEIFRVIDDALPGEESTRRLGGRVEAGGALDFIPFVSEGAVASRYDVRRRYEVPSYRRLMLARMAEREAPLAVLFRESNTLSSTLWRAGRHDSVFLFFTEDAPLLRPALGVANLAAGIGAAALGLAIAPAAGPDTLLGGLRGALFSLPEVAFVSLRKGSFDWVPRADRDAVAAGAPPGS